MGTLYLTDGDDLTSVANAIRAKSGGSGQLAFPSGFVSELGNIPSGGGGYSAQDVATGDAGNAKDITLTGSSLRDYAFRGWNITSLSGTLTGQGNAAFENCKNLTTINLPNFVGGSNNNHLAFFKGCSALVSVNMPKLETAWNDFFRGCTSLKTIVLPMFKRDNSYLLGGCTNLEAVDLAEKSRSNYYPLAANAFNGCTKMATLVLRPTAVKSLGNISAFTNTPFASGKSGGTLYVPSALISSYQSASNWSTILGYSTNSIKSIESTATDPNAPVDLTTHYIDGTLIPT